MQHSYAIDRVQGHTFLRAFLRPNGKVIDLGMHKGGFAKVMHGKYGCTVFGLEANPTLASTLGGLAGISCKEAAISAKDGSVTFAIDRNDLEASKIAPDGTSGSNAAIKVPSISLASFLQEVNATQVDLLKMDVEGAELEVIETTDPGIFRRCSQITVEFHSFLHPEDRGRVENAISILSSYGFYHMDFSTERTDVLFISGGLIDVSMLGKMLLVTQKYRAGITRNLHRRIFGQPQANSP